MITIVFYGLFLAHKYKVDNHRERVSHYTNHFHQLNQGDIQFPLKIKDIPTFERLNNLDLNVFESSASDKSLSPKYVNKNYYDEQIDLLIYENHENENLLIHMKKVKTLNHITNH